MAKCAHCKKDMLKANGCTVTHVTFGDGETLERLPHDGGWETGIGRCGDCNVKVGHLHHPGCDIERCPRCGLQQISCDCPDCP